MDSRSRSSGRGAWVALAGVAVLGLVAAGAFVVGGREGARGPSDASNPALAPASTRTSAGSDGAPAPRATADLDAPRDTSSADGERDAVAPPPPELEFGEDGDAPSSISVPCESGALDVEAGASATPPERAIAGAIRGQLLREGGAWSEATLPRGGAVWLDLVDLAPPHANRRGVLTPVPDANGGLELRFAFEDVPEGEYELTLSALGSVRWAPTALRVRPPQDGITFTRYDADPRMRLAFEVRDARTDAPITAFTVRHVQITPSRDAGVFLQTGPLDVDAFPLDARFAWSLWADGYAAAFGDETAFERRGETRVARVALTPGWSTRVFVLAKDPLARAVAGADVFVDGRHAGVTNASGLCAVLADAPPRALEVRAAGWTMQGDPLAPFGGKTAEQRAHTTIVYLAR